jgi:hypothetical protein
MKAKSQVKNHQVQEVTQIRMIAQVLRILWKMKKLIKALIHL